jgi:predicted metalloprotease with PDZ domain
MTRVYRGEGRFKQSVADSSFDTWTRFYKQDESAPNNIVSYYSKGSLIALALDLNIRHATDHKASLDNVMQQLWQQYGKPLVGVPEKRIEEIASQVAGTDLSDFFERYLYNTEDLPFDKLLREMGIQWQLQATTSLDDKGGKFNDEVATEAVWFGARFTNDTAGANLANVLDNGPAQKAGLSAGDVVIAIDGLKANKQNIEKLLTPYAVNDMIKVHAFRRDELMAFDLVLEPAPMNTIAMRLDTKASDSQVKHRTHWLNSKQP